MNTFEINQIFEGTYPPEAASWCNENGAYIEEIEATTREEERRELVREAEYDEEWNEIIPAEYETITVDVTVRRFQIVAIPEPTQEEKEAQLQKHYTDLIQHILDKEAQKLGYDDCNSVCTYVETGVQKFDDEGVAFRKWRSAVWAKGYEILADVQSGKMEIPTEEELIKLLPALEIVYTVIE